MGSVGEDALRKAEALKGAGAREPKDSQLGNLKIMNFVFNSTLRCCQRTGVKRFRSYG